MTTSDKLNTFENGAINFRFIKNGVPAVSMFSASWATAKFLLGVGMNLDLNNNEMQNAKLGTDIDVNSKVIKDPKNSTNTTVSGTPKTIEIKIGGVAHYILAYPTSSA